MKRISTLIIIVFACHVSIGQLTNSGATIVMTPGTQLVLNNISMVNDGTFNQSAGIVNFNGNANTSIGGSIAPRFYILNLNKLPATLQLQSNIFIGNQFHFFNGILDLGAQHITLDPGAVMANENLTSYAFSTAGGYIETTVPVNAPSSVNVGGLGAVISSSQNLGSVYIRRGHQSQSNGNGTGNSILRYYDINPANNTGLNATLHFIYLDRELNGLDENNLTIWKTTNNVNWTNLGRTAFNTITNFVEQTGINDFGRFTLSTASNPLPLTWGSFNTQCVAGQARISWKTEQEQNTASFSVRRSTNGRDWSAIGTLPAAGNSSGALNYSFTDPNPLTGKVYYQILEVDKDGRQTLSSVLVNECGAQNSLKVFPNPVRQYCQVSIQSDRAGSVMLNLFDSKGALIFHKNDVIQKGNTQLQLKLDNIKQGIHLLLITLPDGSVQSVKIEKV